MERKIKNFLRPFIPQAIFNKLKVEQQKKEFKTWQKNGCSVPSPHLLKQNTIREYQKMYGYTTLVETGTFLGDMIEAQKSRFDKIISIELSIDLFNRAVQRFKNDKHITLVQGDSGKVLSKILSDIKDPVIFWLDGHYSAGITAKGDKDCPIYEELDAILDNNGLNHVLLIDDARDFTGTGDYPTIEELTKYIKSRNSNYKLEVKHDIIRYVI